MVISRVITRVTILITLIRGLITLLITTHEPPSMRSVGRHFKPLPCQQKKPGAAEPPSVWCLVVNGGTVNFFALYISSILESLNFLGPGC